MMNRPLRRIRMAISAIRLIPHIVIMLAIGKESAIRGDLSRWADIEDLGTPSTNYDFVVLFVALMTFMPEFRNIFYMRAGFRGRAFAFLCPPLSSLIIYTRNIGPGLFIQHGISTLIAAKRIGANCWINQQVTIGHSNKTDFPTIGDNVRICPGAKIVGDVRIGDNAVIGLNTVVTANVAPNTTVFGVPARVVWRRKPRPTTA